jgi:hypothetical protein
MTTRKRNVEKIFEHVCFHEKEIMDMHKILVGNGDPEHSLCRQVALIAERQKNVLEALQEAKERRKATPQAIINWASLVFGFIMIVLGYFSLHAGQKDIQADQKVIQAETKVTNDLLAPDSTEATVSIRGNVYIPVLKTDSANIIINSKLDSIYNNYMKPQK